MLEEFTNRCGEHPTPVQAVPGAEMLEVANGMAVPALAATGVARERARLSEPREGRWKTLAENGTLKYTGLGAKPALHSY